VLAQHAAVTERALALMDLFAQYKPGFGRTTIDRRESQRVSGSSAQFGRPDQPSPAMPKDC
jgi:hypothetical protein